jgi:cytochrome c oxidase assembly factor 1
MRPRARSQLHHAPERTPGPQYVRGIAEDFPIPSKLSLLEPPEHPHHCDKFTMFRRSLRPSTVRRLRPHIPRNAVRTIVAAPKPGDGPLMERRSDRALPTPEGSKFLKTLPVFILICTGAAFAFFNYQKSTSSVVESSLYALRVNPEAREVLGDEVYFAHKIPYIWGSIDQLHGKIDISFQVKGTKGQAMMTFRCNRRTRMGFVSILFRMRPNANADVLNSLRQKNGVLSWRTER